eukprot:scaffold139977_cov142-Phaeocystis_antarctica.AAC.1
MASLLSPAPRRTRTRARRDGAVEAVPGGRGRCGRARARLLGPRARPIVQIHVRQQALDAQ